MTPTFVAAAGKRVRHLVLRGSQDAVVLVHGIGGNLGNWFLNQPALAATGRTVAALDLPGHGKSYRDVSDGSLTELSTTLLDYLDFLGFARTHLVGHSMGAAVCLEAARRQPARARSLTLVSPAGLGSPPNLAWARRLVTSRDAAELTQLLQQAVGDPTLVTPEVVEDLLRYKRLEGTIEAQVRILEGVYRDHDVDEALRLVITNQPTLVIWGDRDVVVPALDADAFHGTGVEYHLLAPFGHEVMIEAAPEANRLVDEFVGRSNCSDSLIPSTAEDRGPARGRLTL